MSVRRSYEWAIPVLALVTVAVVWATNAGEVPNPMAIHWGAGGNPDGSGSLGLATALVGALIAAAAGSLLLLRRPMARSTARGAVAGVHGLAALLAGIYASMVAANVGASSWQTAGSLGFGPLVTLLAVGAVFGAAGWWVAGDRADHAIETSSPAGVPIAPGEAIVRSRATTGVAAVRSILTVMVALGVVWALMPVGDGLPMAAFLGLIIAALALTSMTHVRVTVGPRGVIVVLGWLPWPRIRVALEDIAEVAVEEVSPLDYGGWGYRIKPGVRAVVVRRGKSLRIERRDGPTLVVTVDGARTGAGVLLAHLDQQSTPTR